MRGRGPVLADSQVTTVSEQTALSQSIRDKLTEETVALARVAKTCGVPVILSSMASEAFRGSILPPLQALFPKKTEVQRDCINC